VAATQKMQTGVVSGASNAAPSILPAGSYKSYMVKENLEKKNEEQDKKGKKQKQTRKEIRDHGLLRYYTL
jgi:hypothetical protein